MTGQMTIFDFLKPSNDLDSLPEEEMVRIVGNAIGIPFAYKDDLFGWVYSKNKISYSIQYDNYDLGDDLEDGKRFISVDFEDNRSGQHYGCSSPCDSIDKAITFFRTRMERIREGKK